MRIGNFSEEQLRSTVERVERLEEEKANTTAAIRDVYAEAKGNGFNTKAIKECIKLRKLERHERDEQEFVLDTYKKALQLSLFPDEA
jgi:uncharacterized protein (UPF0335 family)